MNLSLLIIFPILLILIIIAFFNFFIKPAGKHFRQRNLKWFFGSYGCILLASLLILQVLPQERIHGDALSDSALARATQAENDFYLAVMDGNPQDVDGIYVIEQWNFAISDKQITMTTTETGGNPINMMIVAERTDELTDEIEVIHYATQVIVARVDLTDGLESPSVTMTGNRLRFSPPPQYQIELDRFQKEFVAAQLLGEADDQQWMIPGSVPDAGQALYLRIPHDLEIDDQTMNQIFFIETQ